MHASTPFPAYRTARVDELIPSARNARTHTDAQVAQIAASIREFGFTSPILTDGNRGVIAGHGRLLAARLLGLTDVPTIELSHLTPSQRRAYMLADNRLALTAGWDDDLLRIELGALRDEGFDLALTGCDTVELGDLLSDAATDAPTAAAEGEDDATDDLPPPRPPVARVGDLWRLGGHRLLCGDSTDPAAVARLFQSEHAALVITSPPYAQQRNYASGGIGDWDTLMQGVFGATESHLTDAVQLLVNLGLVHRDGEWVAYWSAWLSWMRGRGWRRFGLYCWDQGPGLPGDWNGRLAPSFELLFHFNRQARRPNKIIPCTWAGHVNPEKGGLRAKDGTVGDWQHAGRGVQEFRIPDSVLRITRHKARGIEVEHPAVFPVALPEFLMRAYGSAGDLVYEPFSGAGTTILAGERTGCRVAAMELAPGYVDLAIARWQALHPHQQVTLDDGRSYAEIAAERGERADAA